MSYRVLEVTRQDYEQATKIKSKVVCESFDEIETEDRDDDNYYLTPQEKAKEAQELIQFYKQNNIPIPSFLDPTGARL